MKDSARMAACHLRLGEIAAASCALTRVIDGLPDVVERTDLAEIQSDMLFLLRTILDAQERGDHLYLADLLEYELAPLL